MLNSTTISIDYPAHGPLVAQTSHVSTCSRIDQVGRVQAAQVAEALRSCGSMACVQWHGTRATQQSAGEVFIAHLESHPSVTRSNGRFDTACAASQHVLAKRNGPPERPGPSARMPTTTSEAELYQAMPFASGGRVRSRRTCVSVVQVATF